MGCTLRWSAWNIAFRTHTTNSHAEQFGSSISTLPPPAKRLTRSLPYIALFGSPQVGLVIGIRRLSRPLGHSESEAKAPTRHRSHPQIVENRANAWVTSNLSCEVCSSMLRKRSTTTHSICSCRISIIGLHPIVAGTCSEAPYLTFCEGIHEPEMGNRVVWQTAARTMEGCRSRRVAAPTGSITQRCDHERATRHRA